MTDKFVLLHVKRDGRIVNPPRSRLVFDTHHEAVEALVRNQKHIKRGASLVVCKVVQTSVYCRADLGTLTAWGDA